MNNFKSNMGMNLKFSKKNSQSKVAMAEKFRRQNPIYETQGVTSVAKNTGNLSP